MSSILLGLFSIVLLAPGTLPAQTRITPIGQWSAYLSYKNTLQITSKGIDCFAITEGGLLQYNQGSLEIRTFSTIDGMSGISPTAIYHDPLSDLVFIGYEDGMIDFFDVPDEIDYITDIERSAPISKRINSFASGGGYLFIATDFGIVVYDTDADETRFSILKIGSNDSEVPVQDICIVNDTVYAAMGERGLWKTYLNQPNITLPWVWDSISGLNGLPVGDADYVTATSDIIYCTVEDTVFRRHPGSPWRRSPMPTARFTSLESSFDVAYVTYWDRVFLIYPDSSTELVSNGGIMNCAWWDGDEVYLGDKIEGMSRRLSGTAHSVVPDGPINNFVSDLAVGNGEVYIAPRGKKETSSRYFDKSGIPYFSLRNGGWKLNDYRNGNLTFGFVYQDFSRAWYEQSTGKAYLGSWGEGVVELMDGDTVAFYHYTNSPISTGQAVVGDNWSRVSGVCTDAQGNLWITLSIADADINVKTPDGEWYKFNTSGVDPIWILIDDYGRKWMINQYNGLAVFDEGGTLDDPSDDQWKLLNSTAGSGGLPSNNVSSIAEDLDGHIWVGTDAGAVVFYDPGSVFSAGFTDASCPIIDGFCLLRDQKITSIAVDGGNRKWFGTSEGVYVTNDDGTELLYHYTTDNSPLFDNQINVIKIDPETGEVFIGTNSGLISIMGEATEGDDTSDSLYVFPNPIYTDYEGPISINGSVAESEVRITTVSGSLVRELTSLGGQTVWDGRDTWGNKVTPGVYLVMVADKDGEGAGITKIAVVERP